MIASFRANFLTAKIIRTPSKIIMIEMQEAVHDTGVGGRHPRMQRGVVSSSPSCVYGLRRG